SAYEISDEGHLRRRPLLGRHFAGEAMDLAAADGGHVIERLLEDGGEFPLAAGHRTDAELARRRLTGRGVDAEHRQSVAVGVGSYGRGGVLVGQLQLDGTKAGGSGRREPLGQRPLGEEISEIGGETGHDGWNRRGEL